MTRFVIAMVAAGLWLAAAVAIFLIMRRSPGSPGRSIPRFRRARRRLAPQRTGKIRLPSPDELEKFSEARATFGSSGRNKAIEQAPMEHPQAETEPLADQHPLDGETEFSLVAVAADTLPSLETLAETTPADPEIAEIDAIISSITDESPRRKRHRVDPNKPPPRGPRKIGRVTYVLVDDEGRPEID